MQTHSNGYGCKRLSTLDIISSKIDGESLYRIAETGDLLLWANDKPQTKHWLLQLILAFGGTATVEGRCPIWHSAVVVKNPPRDVREAYSLTHDDDGDVYVFDAAAAHAHGARLLPIKKFLELETFPGCRVMLRKLAQTNISSTPCTATPELWQWILHARTVPYAITPVAFFNMATVSGAYYYIAQALCNSFMDMLDNALGKDGPLTRIASGCLGLLVTMSATLFLYCNFVLVLLLCWLPMIFSSNEFSSDCTLCTFLGGRFPMVGQSTENDKAVTSMFCSFCTAITLQRAGIMSTSHPANWMLPKDFVPDGIGQGVNKLDNRLNEGFHYANNFQEVVPNLQVHIQQQQANPRQRWTLHCTKNPPKNRRP